MTFRERVQWFQEERGLALAEAVYAAREFDPTLHPRDRRGRYLDTPDLPNIPRIPSSGAHDVRYNEGMTKGRFKPGDKVDTPNGERTVVGYGDDGRLALVTPEGKRVKVPADSPAIQRKPTMAAPDGTQKDFRAGWNIADEELAGATVTPDLLNTLLTRGLGTGMSGPGHGGLKVAGRNRGKGYAARLRAEQFAIQGSPGQPSVPVDHGGYAVGDRVSYATENGASGTGKVVRLSRNGYLHVADDRGGSMDVAPKNVTPESVVERDGGPVEGDAADPFDDLFNKLLSVTAEERAAAADAAMKEEKAKAPAFDMDAPDTDDDRRSGLAAARQDARERRVKAERRARAAKVRDEANEPKPVMPEDAKGDYSADDEPRKALGEGGARAVWEAQRDLDFQTQSLRNMRWDAVDRYREEKGIDPPKGDLPALYAAYPGLPEREAQVKVAAESVEQMQRAAGGHVFRVAEANLPGLVEKVEKLNRRAKRLKVAPVTLSLTDEREEERVPADPDQDPMLAIHFKVVPYRFVTIDGETPKYDGWRFAATLDRSDGQDEVSGVAVRRVPTFGDAGDSEAEALDLESYRFSPNACDHCKKNRQRKSTFVVVHDKSGETKQVGSECIKDFLGGNDPKRMGAAAEWLNDLMGSLKEGDDDGGQSFGNEKSFPSTDEFLAHAAALINAEGYKARWRDGERTSNNTADAVGENMNAMYKRMKDKRSGLPLWKEPTDADRKLAKDALEWVRTEVIPKEDKSEFEHNLSVYASMNYVSQKGQGFMAYVPQAYKKATEKKEAEVRKEEANAKAQAESSHVGTVGKRMSFKSLEVTRVGVYDGNYGTVFPTNMQDEDGNQFLWWASKRLEPGEVYNFDAMVKAHSTDKYTKAPVTELNRPTKWKQLDGRGEAPGAQAAREAEEKRLEVEREERERQQNIEHEAAMERSRIASIEARAKQALKDEALAADEENQRLRAIDYAIRDEKKEAQRNRPRWQTATAEEQRAHRELERALDERQREAYAAWKARERQVLAALEASLQESADDAPFSHCVEFFTERGLSRGEAVHAVRAVVLV